MLESGRLIEVLEEGKIVKQSTHALSNKCGIVWSESVGDLAQRVEGGEFADVMQQVKEHAEKLMLATISDVVGHGVRLHPNAREIDKGQWVSIYAGEKKYYPGDDYCLTGISAKKRGNMGRFFSHLPTNFDLLAYEIDESVNRDEIATANLFVKYLDEKKEIPALVSLSKINGGEVMGFSYGKNYWSARNIEPKLLTKSGTVLSDNLYTTKNPMRLKLYEAAECLVMMLIEMSEKNEIQYDLMQCKSFEEVYERIYSLIIEGYQNAADEVRQNVYISLLTMYAGAQIEFQLSRICEGEVLLSEEHWPEEIKEIMGCLVKNEAENAPPCNQQTLEATIRNLGKLLFSRVPEDGILGEMKPALESVRAQLKGFQALCQLEVTEDPASRVREDKSGCVIL